ncbi:MAG: HNH endonuclease [Clostridia bacterium]|nr:HNH endonuclease [Clostridia bacterium]
MQYVLNKYHRNETNESLIDNLKEVAKSLQKDTITMNDYNAYGKYHSSTLIRRFGSWFKCLELADLLPSRSKLNISEDELFENLENIWKHFGRQPRYHEIIKPLSKFSVGTYEKRFGTYYNALEAFINAVNGEQVEVKKNLTSNENPRNINYRLRFRVMQRDKFKCRICGASPATDPTIILHIDHIVPCAKGGTADFENLQTLCSKCNLGKSDLNM